MVGCDLHDASLVLKVASGREPGEMIRVANEPAARQRMWSDLRKRAEAGGGTRIVFAYEASSLGFGLHDEAVAAGVESYVLAPTKIARSTRDRRRKTDAQDAERLLDLVRGHVLAGIRMPSVWVPDVETRDDREIVRGRGDVAEKVVALKAQIRTLLKRNGIERTQKVQKKK